MNKRDDRIDDEMAYIFNDYLTDVEDLESAFITEKDIVKRSFTTQSQKTSLSNPLSRATN